MGDYPYERYAKIRDLQKLSDYKVTKLAGIKGTATISNWKNGKYTPKDDKMQDIAQVLGVTVDFLSGKTDTIECEECGYKYNPLDEFDCAIHDANHSKIMKARKRYSCLIPFNEIYSISRKNLESVKKDSDNIAIALDKYLKAEFSYYVYKNYEDDRPFDFFDFGKTKVVELINSGEIPENEVSNVLKWYKIDKDYIDIKASTLARASKNPQLMRLLTYAEKLKPEALNMLVVQAKALSEQK